MSYFVVVDASLAFKWLVKEEGSDKADALSLDWHSQGIRLTAPYFMAIEVVNALHQRVKRSETAIDEGLRLVDRLLSENIEFYHFPSLYRRALELASELGQGAAYDAHYLALAEILDCEMWTADERLYGAANQVTTRVRLLADNAAT